MKEHPQLSEWVMEYQVRKELGGYFPEEDEYDKQHFYRHLYLSLKKEEMKKHAMDKLKSQARRGGN